MKFIAEDIIEDSIAYLDASEAYYEQTVQHFQAQQPIAFTYLFAEGFALLTEEEQGLLRYMALVVWRAVTQTKQQPARHISQEEIGQAEEANWEKFNVQKGSFRDKLDIFFADTDQEDLLAFLEDTLMEDEEDKENDIAPEARATLFISLKSIIDCL
jgi:hypothetical protein